MTLSDLHVELPLQDFNVVDFKLSILPNEHATARLVLAISAKPAAHQMAALYPERPIVIRHAGETVLFQGLLRSSTITDTNNVYLLTLNCISSTWLMDKQQHCQSFQKTSQTYEDIIQLRCAPYKGGFAGFADLSHPIPQLVLQYHETDWAFIKRMVSWRNAVVYPVMVQSGVHFQVGFTQYCANTYQPDMTCSSVLHNYDTQYYMVDDTEFHSIGESVYVFGNSLWIISVTAAAIGNEIVFTYKIGQPIAMKPQYNITVIGASLRGTVIGHKNNRLYLHLEIDKDRPPQKEHSFAYRPLTVSGLFAMPEKDTCINLYIPNQDEASAYAVEAVGSSDETRPRYKEFRTIHQKYFLMNPSTIHFYNGQNTFDVSLLPEDISIHAKRNLQIKSRNKIKIHSAHYVNIKAGQQITLLNFRGVKSNITVADEILINTKQLGFITSDTQLHEIPTAKPVSNQVSFSQIAAASAITASTPSIMSDGAYESKDISIAAVLVAALVIAAAPVTVGARNYTINNFPKVKL